MFTFRHLLRLAVQQRHQSRSSIAPSTYFPSSQFYSSDVSLSSEQLKVDSTEPRKITTQEHHSPKRKTQAELDKELELKMKGLAGEGGEAGVEYEDGQPIAMKRSVRNNMFRYI
ncbi:hypothetical protein CC78DRAFT_531324 [Lojkania enalia]|uniref:Uncharacterized protein n=1 Tax=Lojkania enalia TaxID=147567 RepID=A0A9P4KFT5_9PLEO|nr:hypothetical protein CC78DRAFT_531324 [Didymosphaeria enalia]